MDGKEAFSRFKVEAAKLPKRKDYPKEAATQGTAFGDWVEKQQNSLEKLGNYDLDGKLKKYNDKLKELRELKQAYNDDLKKVKELVSTLNNQSQRVGAEGKSLIEQLKKSQDKDAKAQGSQVSAFIARNANGGFTSPDPIDDKI